MNKLKPLLSSYIKLSARQKTILPLIFFLLGIMRIVIKVLPFRIIVKYFLKPKYIKSTHNSKFTYKHARVIGNLTSKVAKITPWESKCLVQGLACRVLLRLFNLPSIFYIGVAKDSGQKFISHAWINCGDYTIVGGKSSFDEFKIISQYEDKIV